jgi:hypothetical protein
MEKQSAMTGQIWEWTSSQKNVTKMVDIHQALLRNRVCMQEPMRIMRITTWRENTRLT